MADILIIVDATPAFGHIDKQGNIVWNPAIFDFLNQFISDTPMGLSGNRIGVLVTSKGVDDMVPISPDKPYLLHSLNELRPSFQSGCTEKGISIAISLFYQYGRPLAVKRIVLLSDSAMKCQYRSMAQIIYARKSGIDIVHVGFGPGEGHKTLKPTMDKSFFMVPVPKMLPKILKKLEKRVFMGK